MAAIENSPTSLEDLNERLTQIVGGKGIDELSEEEVATIKLLMTNYQSNPADWKKFAHFDEGKYTRNLVSDGNGKYNLMLLCWSEGQGSAIHDHAGSHCIMKILDGELLETQFEWPKEEGHPLAVLKETGLKLNQAAYMHDKIGLHRVENPSHTKKAISLHMYTPPYSECRAFSEESGVARRSGYITFHTVNGNKVERVFNSVPK